MLPAVLQAKSMTLGSGNIGKILQTEEGFYYVDVAKNPFARHQKAFLFIDREGNIDVVFEGMKFKNKYIIKSETEGMPPATNLFDFDILTSIHKVDLKEAFELAKEVARQTIVFHNERFYDLVVAWCMYTWLRGLFPKNINLYFVGFPATGKSQALKFCKHFARYPVDYDPTAEKSYKWNISHTLGTICIDEAEYINKMQAAKLRKYHEANVVETRMIGLPVVGLTSIDLRVDAPLVMSATHPPADTAFLQRGFIIRMYKGKPEIKDFDLIPDLEERKIAFAKSVLCHWAKVFETLNRIYVQISFMNIDERVKDLIMPICTFLELVGVDWKWVVDYARYSFTQANFITPETTAFMQTISLVRKEAQLWYDKYVLPVEKVSEIIRRVAHILGADPSKLNYLRQYLFAGCEVMFVDGTLCYVADRKTVDSLVKDLQILELKDVKVDAFDVKGLLARLPQYCRSSLYALAKYILDHEAELGDSVVEVPLEDVRPYLKGTKEARRGNRDLVSWLSKQLSEKVRLANEIGVVFKADGGMPRFIVDLSKVKHYIDFMLELNMECKGKGG